jgi:uncharacterized protein (TIGR00106 family)
MTVLIDFSIFPVGKGESVSSYVARAVKVIHESGLSYRLHAMGTNIEGEWSQVMDVVNRCFDALQKDCQRIYATIKIDFRRGGRGRLVDKVKSVDKKLQSV